MRPNALLLTGRPGVGKTTIVRRIVASLSLPAGGFFTEEVRAGGMRIGFDLITLDGQRVPLARVGLASPCRVGRYGVDRDSLEKVGVAALQSALDARRLMVVDEIGRMELCSPLFGRVVEEALQQGVPLLGTIMQKPHPFADRIKSMPGVRLLEVLPNNREQVLEEVKGWLLAAGALTAAASPMLENTR